MHNSLKEIALAHPSKCYTCVASCRPCSKELINQGFVGCTMFAKEPIVSSSEVAEKAEFVGTGWVDLKSYPKLGKGSGIMTNYQLLTKKVTECSQYEELKNYEN